MAHTPYTMDRRPGSVPDIHVTADGITFTMTPAGAPAWSYLVIRCDGSGEVWVSIRTDPPPAADR